MRRPRSKLLGRNPIGLALLVLATLVGTFGSSSHWLTTPHRLCEVHGTLEHLGEDEDDVVSIVRAAPSRPVLHPEPRMHAACEFGTLAAPDIVPVDLESRTVFAAPPPRTACAPGAVVLASEPLFGLAPSRSPPAALEEV